MQRQTKMLQFRRTFENEQIQLQDLNARLRQYLSRVKDLEQDNALLIKEINTIRRERTVERENQYLAELRELRQTVNQLTLEKSRAEVEREKLGRELQTLQALCCEETVICRDIEGERKGFEKQLQQALKNNVALEERLLQLQNEYMCLEDAHKRDISHLRNEVHSRALPVVITQTYQGHPAITMEEMEEYAQLMSESLNENFEVYCRRIEDLENSIKANQAMLEDLQREKTQYVSELKTLHAEAQKQNKLQLRLEDELIQMQDRFHMEIERYQNVIGELEEERRMMAYCIAEKLKEYQQLMQVKMGLGLEVATYRALLEGERKVPIQIMDQHARETSRRIDIKMPAKPWSTTTRQEVQRQYPLSTGLEARYTDLATSLKTSFGTTSIRPTSPARVVPININVRNQRSATPRRDIPSFTKTPQVTTNVHKTTVEERNVRTTEPLRRPGFAPRFSPGPAPMKEKTTIVTSSTAAVDAKGDNKHDFRGLKVDKTEDRKEKDANKVTVKEWTTPVREDVRTSNIPKRSEVHSSAPEDVGTSDRLPSTTHVQKTIVEERVVRTKEPLQKPAKDSADQHQQDVTTKTSLGPAPMKEKTTIVMSSAESTKMPDAKGDSKPDSKGLQVDKDENKVTMKEWMTPDWEDVKTSNFTKNLEIQSDAPEKEGSGKTLPATTHVQKTIVEERTVRCKEPPQKPEKDSVNELQPGFEARPNHEPALLKDKTTVFMTSTESTFVVNGKDESKHDLKGHRGDMTEGKEEKDANKVTMKEWTTPDWEDVKTSNFTKSLEVQSDAPEKDGSGKTLPATTHVQKTIVEERIVRSKELPQKPAKDSVNELQPGFDARSKLEPVPMKEKTTAFTTLTESTFVVNEKGESKYDLKGHKPEKTESRDENDAIKVTMKEWKSPDWEEIGINNVPEKAELHHDDPEEVGSGDEKIVDYIYMEEIIEKVMKPAGLDTKFINPTPDSKVAYRVEKCENEDGKTKTQIILESRVEEDVDIADKSTLEELLSKGVTKVSLEDIKGTPTGSAIENLLSLHGDGSGIGNKSVNVEIIEEPVEDHDNEESEAKPAPTFSQPSSMFFQIEELDSDSHGAKLPVGKTEVSKPTPTKDTEYQKEGSTWVKEGYKEADDPYFSHAQETEYFVSTPDDSISEPEEERGISSYGHYGVVDDLSDERYYQDVPPVNPRFEEDKGYRSGHRSSYMASELGFSKDRFPECIIEEEVQVSPTVQESMMGHLTEDYTDPMQQLRGDLDKLEGNVSKLIQDEVFHVIKKELGGTKNLSMDVKKVQESSDNGTVTITAELRDLDDSDLPEDSKSDEQMLASSHPGLQHPTGTTTVREYSVKIIRDQDAEPESMAAVAGVDGPGAEGFHGQESVDDVHTTERVIRLGPTERSLTFQMDIGNIGSATSLPAEGGTQEFQGFFTQSQGMGGPSGEGVYTYVRKTTVTYDQGDEPTDGHGHEGEGTKWDDFPKQPVEFSQTLQTHFFDPQLKDNQEKKIATVYLDTPENI